MKRDIACEECSWKYFSSGSGPDGPAETVKRVRGIALQDYCCDRCNKKIPKGSECVAISVVVEGQEYYGWEHEFVKVPND